MRLKNSARLVRRIALLLLVPTVTVAAVLTQYSANETRITSFKPYYAQSVADPVFHSYDPAKDTREPDDRVRADSVPVLLYHGITRHSNPETDYYSVKYENFRDQLIALHREGYRTITLEQYKQFRQGKITLPEKSFLLTFDDGRKDSYYPVDPILKWLGYNAVMYIISKTALSKGSTYYLRPDELQDMAESGRWEFGLHAKDSHIKKPTNEQGTLGNWLSNPLYLPEERRTENTSEYADRLGEEFTQGKQQMMQVLGNEVTTFAFPFGDYGQDTTTEPNITIPIIRDTTVEHFDLRFAQRLSSFSRNASPKSKPEDMETRIEVVSKSTVKDVLSMVTAGEPKQLPIDGLADPESWVRESGQIRFVGDMELDMADRTSVSTLLDGTRHLSDYTMTVKGQWNNKDAVTVRLRLSEPETFAGCTFVDGGVTAMSVVDGERRELDMHSVPVADTDTSQFAVHAQVLGDILTCVGRDVIAEGRIPEHDHGGVGIRAWNSRTQSVVSIKDVAIQEPGSIDTETVRSREARTAREQSDKLTTE